MSHKPKDMVSRPQGQKPLPSSHSAGQMSLRPQSQKLDAQLAALDHSHQQRQNSTAKVHKLAPTPRPKPR